MEDITAPQTKPPILNRIQENILVSYILKMEERGFGLTVIGIRKLAYQMANKLGVHGFSEENKSAGYDLWISFAERHPILSVRKPEGLSAARSSMLNPSVVSAYFEKLGSIMEALGVKDKPQQLFNADESRISTVHNPEFFFGKRGKRAEKLRDKENGINKGKVPDTESIPVGLRKMKEAGLYNVIFELDLGDSTYDFDRFRTEEICALLKKWVDWVFENLSKEAKVFINFRDLPDAMPTDSDRVFEVTDFLCKLPLFGLMFEEPRGQSLPEECGTWAKHIRKVMEANHFKGHLLVHVHEKFGYCDAVALQVLMDGADGIWASVIKEGAAMGNAPSIVTILNLIRMGNKKVLKKFNCTYLRKAAINMTRITTGVDPHIKQPVYGARALDFVFDLNPEEFDFADFFDEKAPIRITTLSSAEMVRTKLVNYFGENEDFTIERANLMKEVMLKDLRGNRKEEYMSKCGLAVLYDRSGGKLTDEIRDEIANDPVKTPHGQNLLKEIRERWDEWDLKDKVQGDNLLDFDSFYNGFMSPYFACYRCNDTKKALQALDMDSDNSVDWTEFCIFLKWAIKQYPKTIHTADDLLEVAFRKGLIPCMRDELVVRR
ncbi:unnamed protein product [Mytilus coruscus]|uniref:EF-hand domain-containing protein n=1 Tax=Mytilus coruscus TaxID=42192 RepID=A0A6J8CC10_MYTCO|nr:unnamed protein product [Mytilus coruscus]